LDEPSAPHRRGAIKMDGDLSWFPSGIERQPRRQTPPSTGNSMSLRVIITGLYIMLLIWVIER
jgi:hypothetical protein